MQPRSHGESSVPNGRVLGGKPAPSHHVTMQPDHVTIALGPLGNPSVVVTFHLTKVVAFHISHNTILPRIGDIGLFGKPV